MSTHIFDNFTIGMVGNKVGVYVGPICLSMGLTHRKDVLRFFYKFIIYIFISYFSLAKTMGPAQSIAQVLVQTVYQCHSYWARHWPRPKLYAELGGIDVFLKLTACRKYIISSQNMV